MIIGGAIASAAMNPPAPSDPRNSAMPRATSETSSHATPIASNVVAGTRNRFWVAVRNAMARASASIKGTRTAHTRSPNARPRSARYGSTTASHTPSPTAMPTIAVSIGPNESSSGDESCPSIARATMRMIAETRWNASPADGNVSDPPKYRRAHSNCEMTSNPSDVATSTHARHATRLMCGDAEPDGAHADQRRNHSDGLGNGVRRQHEVDRGERGCDSDEDASAHRHRVCVRHFDALSSAERSGDLIVVRAIAGDVLRQRGTSDVDRLSSTPTLAGSNVAGQLLGLELGTRDDAVRRRAPPSRTQAARRRSGRNPQ